MARRRPPPTEIGATQAPDVVSAELRWLEQAQLEDVDFGESRLRDAVLRGCKLDYANFRNATIENVGVEDCVLRGADFQGARLRAVDTAAFGKGLSR